MKEPSHCPLCGFLLMLDYDNHLVPCIVRHARLVWFKRDGRDFVLVFR